MIHRMIEDMFLRNMKVLHLFAPMIAYRYEDNFHMKNTYSPVTYEDSPCRVIDQLGYGVYILRDR